MDELRSKKNVNVELDETEKNIIKLGDDISDLLLIIKKVLEGDNNCTEQCTNKLKNILSQIEEIKKTMHKLVEEVYSKKNFAFISKMENDNREREKEFKKIDGLFRYLANINSNKMQNRPNDKADKVTFSTSK